MISRIPIESRVKGLFHSLRDAGKKFGKRLSVLWSTFVRIFGIPVLMVGSVDWNACNRNPILVFFDHLYIYFVLGYFPDNYNSCRLWEVDRSNWSKYLGSGYDPRAIFRRGKHIIKPEHAILFEDKEVCYHLCQSFGLPLPKQYGVIDSDDDFSKTITSYFTDGGAEEIILKDISGCGGSGIHKVEKSDGNLIVRDASNPTQAISIDQFEVKNRSVAQEFVTQHPEIDSISDKALNTVYDRA